jgi:hypothetical protein
VVEAVAVRVPQAQPESATLAATVESEFQFLSQAPLCITQAVAPVALAVQLSTRPSAETVAVEMAEVAAVLE